MTTTGTLNTSEVDANTDPAPDIGVVWVDADLRIVRCNPIFSEVFQVAGDRGKVTLADVLPRPLLSSVIDLIEQLSRSNEAEASSSGDDQSMRTPQTLTRVTREGDGFRIIIRSSLRTLRQWLMWNSFFEQSMQLFAVASDDGYFLELNQKWEDVLGYDREYLCARPYAEFVHPDDQEKTARELERLLDGDPVLAFRNRYRHRDGGWRWLEWRAVPGIVPGRICAVAADVTEEVERSARREERQRADLVCELVGGIAHDFNNLLSTIIGLSGLTRDSVESAELRNDLDTILSAAQKASELSRQLIAVGRESVLSASEIDPLETLGRAVGLASAAMPRGIRLVFEHDWEGTLLTDESALERITLNLLMNAREAMPDGGTITLTCRRYRAASRIREEPKDYFQLTVCDEGPGIPPAQREKVFEPYFTTRPESGGTGLGLAVGRGLARQLDGSLEVVDHPGDQGACFRLLLPVRKDTNGDGVLPPAREIEKMGRQDSRDVLVVDDQGTIGELVGRILQRSGLNPVVESDPLAALQRFEAGERYDLLITDLVMPGLSGMELLERLGESANLPRAVILMGGNIPRRQSLACLADVPYVFLPKPFGPRELRDAVNELLD